VTIATDSVWSNISLHFHGVTPAGAIHTFVYKDQHNIKTKLGYLPTISKKITFILKKQ
jgi:hypothetical protein